MKDFKRKDSKRSNEKTGSNQPSKKSRNVSRLQERQLKRGRFTAYP